MAGQINHFLITILVGLAAVQDETAALPPDMRTSWDPRDRSRSAARSREFAIKALVAWLVDALDAYIRALQNSPRIAGVAAMERIADANANSEGLAGRLRAVATAVGQTASPEAILSELAIIWRNRLVHQHATNRIEARLASAARAHRVEFVNFYQGLLVDDLIRRVQSKPSSAPTLKEATAIVRAVHKFIERADEYFLRDLDLAPYLREVLRQYLTENREVQPASVMTRAGNVWGRSPDRRLSTIRQIALNNGFTTYRDGAPNEIIPSTIEQLANFSPSEAVKALVIDESEN